MSRRVVITGMSGITPIGSGWKEVRESLQSGRSGVVRMDAWDGIAGLRKEVAKKYRNKYGVELDPETEIIATIGSKEGFSHLCLAMLGPGDTAVVGDPAFPIHVYAVAMAGANRSHFVAGRTRSRGEAGDDGGKN